MEPALHSFHIVFGLLIFTFILVKVKLAKKSTLNLPPGPYKLPIIGSIHHLGSALPHKRLRELAEIYGPLMHLQLGELSVIVISSPETAKEVMKVQDLNFADRPYLYASSVICNGAENLTFAAYGEYWRRVRKLCVQDLLCPARVQSFGPAREQEVSDFVKSVGENVGSEINVSERIFSLMYGITAKAAFGNKCKDEEVFIKLVKEGSAAAAGFNVSDLFPSSKLLPLVTGFKAKLERIRARFEEIVDNIIEEHKEKKLNSCVCVEDEDFVDVLLRFQECDDAKFSLSLANIRAIILDIFSAGSETTSTTVEWAMSEMLKHPKILEKAQIEIRKVVTKRGTIDETCIQEIRFLKLVIKETLRLHPPAPLLLPRQSRDRCEINGYEIPAKSKVIVNAWAINRDPKSWKDPDAFDPERFIDNAIDFKGIGGNFEFIPFGGGRRVCPGISFGLANVEFCLVKLLYHFDWKLADGMTGDDLDMSESFGVTVRRKTDLVLVPSGYYPLPA